MMDTYSWKKFGDEYAVLQNARVLWFADLATARRDVREFNKAESQGMDNYPLFWWCKCKHPNYQTSNKCEECGRERSPSPAADASGQ